MATDVSGNIPRESRDRAFRGLSPFPKTAVLWAGILASAIAGVLLVRLPAPLLFGSLGFAIVMILIVSKPFTGLLLYLSVFELRLGEMVPALSPLHLERLIGAVTLFALLIMQYRRDRRIHIDGSGQTRLLLVFVAAVLLSVPFAYWRLGAFNGFVELLKILTFYVLIVHLIDCRRRLRIFVFLYIGLTLYVAATSFHDYLAGSLLHAQGIDRAVGETSAANNPNQLGTSMAVVFPLVVLLFMHRPMGVLRYVLGCGAALVLATMAVTGSRASLVGFLGGLAFLAWTSSRRILVGFAALALLLGGFAVLPDQYKERYKTIGTGDLDGSSRARVETWLAGLEMAASRPLFGVGIACFGAAHAADFSAGRPNWLESHSLYLQVLAETGLVGTASFLLLIFQMLRTNRQASRLLRSRRMGQSFEAVLVRGMLAGFIVLLLSGVFGHSLLRRTWYVYAALGLAVLRITQSKGSASQDSSSAQQA